LRRIPTGLPRRKIFPLGDIVGAMAWEIRIADPADAAAVADVYAPYVRDNATSFEAEAPTAGVMADRIAACVERLPWLVCAQDGVLAGYAYAGFYRDRAAYRWSVETSVYVTAARRRTGVGAALYGALLELLTRQGFAQAFAGITLPNGPSVAFHARFGFERIALYRAVGYKLGRWHDVAWMQRPLIGGGPDPVEPVPFSRSRSEPAVRELLVRSATALG
jgi:L-amino acid N-acyltransferase YncA